ncbi:MULTISPECIES: glucose-6-phosphate dehydrogenase [Chitinophagaceae]|uniref:glucose-6-phosphate dehydrogenase n=1 Tax=Chitinophagaceae TaxID=563835 RepID=UPI000DEEDCC1|nr:MULTISPECIES: glucose-6-phosphate dehydrogenase [Chitinophagaceae]RPD44427.1 glucose-6-phosphate dehydrogenase [Paracnuella aquatica]
MQPTIVFIFGGAGDLAQRKLLPALFNLYLDGNLPEQFFIAGIGRSALANGAYKKLIKEGIDEHARRKEQLKEHWDAFSKNIEYLQVDASKDAEYKVLGKKITALQKEWGAEATIMYYLSVAPQLAPAIAASLHGHKLANNPALHRLVFEKPFGHDLQSARELNGQLTKLYAEEQIFRIDHFLGKETVQNILAFRFANTMFEPIWNHRYIDHVQITATETVGVLDRGAYFEGAGALRDMVQNHMLQLLCMVAMEPPVSFNANEVRNKKHDVLKAIRCLRREEVHTHAVRGQYASGWVEGKKRVAYREEASVAPQSGVETYAAIKLFIDNWRWNGVPFYVRTGKSLAEKTTHISVQFKSAPSYSFPAESVDTWRPNRLLINISPKLDIRLRFQAKQPGQQMTLQPVEMVFNYFNETSETQPEAYETLLQDVIEGDATLFMRADQVERAWAILAPIMEVWGTKQPVDFPNYASGSWGPEDAEALIARDGNHWTTLPLNGG